VVGNIRADNLLGVMVTSLDEVAIEDYHIRTVSGGFLDPLHRVHPATPQPFLERILLDDDTLTSGELWRHQAER
jgi:hypothetical protein